jgi:Tol biopolymer transport system component
MPTPRPTSTPTTTPTKTPTATPTATPTKAPNFGGKLAISLKLGNQSKVYITGFEGDGINGPSPFSLNAKHPMFSRDGESLIINGRAGIITGVFVADSWGQAPRLLIGRESAFWPAVSPDGNELMFAEMTLDRKLFRRSSDGVISEVTANNRPILVRNLLWSDDNQLVFQSCETWNERPGECGIWVTNADNINPIRIVVGNDGWPMDARHGFLAYMSAEDGDWDIYLVSLGGGEPRNITANDYQDGLAAIAPDGRSVAYISNQAGQWALWTLTLRNGQKQKWFDIDPQRGEVDVYNWHNQRMSWTQ